MSDTTASPAGASRATQFSPGEQLRAARERAGWTQERLAAELCLPVERLRALELDEHASFGGVVYVRGYLRRAAGLLGVSPQELIAAYESACDAANPAEIVPSLPPGNLPRRGPPEWLGPAAGAAALMAVIGSTWWLLGPSGDGASTADSAPAPAALEFTAAEEPRVASVDPVPRAPEPEPAMPAGDAAQDELPAAAAPSPSQVVERPRTEVTVVATQELAAPPPGTVELRFEFSEDCWLEVVDAEDRQLAYRLHRSGDVARLRGTAPIAVFLGNADGARLTVDGTAVPVRPARRDGTARLTVGGGAG
ncbi:MAG TPA: RodZ domain-containing protein [Gammaproteobacteria bacterium]|nr:RodZ domain-containing protein [Gammaproteobacteria bacterium]